MKIGIVGNYGHRSISHFPGVTIVRANDGYLDPDASVSQSGEGRYSSLEEMLEKETPDLVYIGSVYAWNGPLAVRALERGYSVVCEKPLAVDRETLSRLRELTASGERRIVAELTMRWFPAYEKARELVQSGAIGRPIFVQAQKSYKFGSSRPAFYKQRELFGGIIPWVASHAVDFASWVADLPYEAVEQAQHGNRAHPDYPEMEDYAVLSLRMKGGVSCSITADFLRPAGASSHGDDRLRITGTKGVLEILGSTLLLSDGEGEQRWELPLDDQVYERTAKGLVAAALGQPSAISMDESLRMTEIVLAAREAADAVV